MYADDPLAGLSRAATTAGDSDSIACLAGAFLGAAHGLAAWPAEWAERIEYADQLGALGQDLGLTAAAAPRPRRGLLQPRPAHATGRSLRVWLQLTDRRKVHRAFAGSSMRDDWVTKLAYTGAEAFVATALTTDFDWLRQRLDDVLGPRYPPLLTRSRDRLDRAATKARADERPADHSAVNPWLIESETRSEEIQAWGERLGDALCGQPDLAIRLRSIVDEASVRLLLAPPATATRGLRLL